MTGDLIRRLSEQGEREDLGAPDPWIPLGSAIPEFILEVLGLEPPLAIEPPAVIAARNEGGANLK